MGLKTSGHMSVTCMHLENYSFDQAHSHYPHVGPPNSPSLLHTLALSSVNNPLDAPEKKEAAEVAAYHVEAHLGGALLGGAHLGGAHLGGALLGGARLGGARLGGAHLGGAHLGEAKEITEVVVVVVVLSIETNLDPMRVEVWPVQTQHHYLKQSESE